MRALLGGAIGAVAAAAAWLAVDHFTQASWGWLVVLVGLVTGMCVRRSGGDATRGSFTGGALAIVLTLAAIAGGQQVYAMVMRASSTSATPVEFTSFDNVATDTDGKEADANETDAAGSDVRDTVASNQEEEAAAENNAPGEADNAPREIDELDLEELPEIVVDSGYSKTAIKKNFSQWDMVWMCLAALAAYVTGKGSGKPDSLQTIYSHENRAGQSDVSAESAAVEDAEEEAKE